MPRSRRPRKTKTKRFKIWIDEEDDDDSLSTSSSADGDGNESDDGDESLRHSSSSESEYEVKPSQRQRWNPKRVLNTWESDSSSSGSEVSFVSCLFRCSGLVGVVQIYEKNVRCYAAPNQKLVPPAVYLLEDLEFCI